MIALVNRPIAAASLTTLVRGRCRCGAGILYPLRRASKLVKDRSLGISNRRRVRGTLGGTRVMMTSPLCRPVYPIRYRFCRETRVTFSKEVFLGGRWVIGNLSF